MVSPLVALVFALAPLQDPVEQETEDLTVEVQEEPEAAPSPAQLTLGALAGLRATLDVKEADLKREEEFLPGADTEEERLAALARAHDLHQEIDRLTEGYDELATGIDLDAFSLAQAEQFDLASEFQELVQPIVEELKSATEAPRQIESLRGQLKALERQEALAREAVRNIEMLLEEVGIDDNLGLGPSLRTELQKWQSKVEELSSTRSVKLVQLNNRLAQRTSIVESTRTVLGNFFRTRGLNLILAIASCVLVIIVMRGLYLSAKRILRRRNPEELAFYSRLFDVLYGIFSGLAAVVAVLLVLYATGDWVLLGITLLFLVGVAWAGKTAVPMFLEQIRLLLNFGTVRERERVIIDGIPYRVSRLSFYTLLSNAELAGGVRRLPLRDLMEMRSRVCSKDEIWFPCRRHDWVLLSDGNRGEITHQSPDSVQIELLGGSHVTYRTPDFLALAPQNLSQGFRLTQRFGIDYKHQAISTTEAPKVFTDRIRARLAGRFGDDAVVGFKVEFVEAGASSLDYLVLADMSGDVARDYEAIKRVIQSAFVDTCNDRGWEIPFTQVTLHQAS